VPKELPALLRAHRLQSRASRVGFDWTRLKMSLLSSMRRSLSSKTLSGGRKRAISRMNWAISCL